MQQKKQNLLTPAFGAIRKGFITAIIFSFFINLLAFVGPLYMLQIYDRVLGSRNVGTLVALTTIASLLLVVYALLEKVRSAVLVRLGLLFADRARDPLFGAVLKGSIAQPGAGHTQALRDLDTIREFMTGAGLISFCDAPWVPIFVAACFMMHLYFGLVAAVGALLIFVLAVANEFLTRDQLKSASRDSVAATTYASATFRNADVLYAMGMLEGLKARWLEKQQGGLTLQASASDRAGLLVAGSKFVRSFLQVAILGVGAYLALNQEASAGAMVAASILMGRALAPVEIAVSQWKSFVAARTSYDRIRTLSDLVANEPKKMPLPPPRGAISVESAIVFPPTGRDAILREISFQLQPGEILGLVGPSAAGKSSLARALVGVWKPAVGKIRIDGAELVHWDAELLGKYIGYLPQDVELFGGTVAENICRFGEENEEAIIGAARLAGVHDMIQALPGGYNTQIGDGGLALSGGQRQRIGLARALYGAPPFIVLDEPNSSLDADGEAALLSAVQQLRQRGSTLVLISHKTNILAVVDKVLLLNQGRVQSFGPRDDVLAKLMGPRVAPIAAPSPVAAAR